MYSLQTQLGEATNWLQDRMPFQPEIAIVLGSGLSGITDTLDAAAKFPFVEIPHYPRVTVEGHRGILIFAKSHDVSVVFACGRHHLYEGYSLDEITFSTRLFARIGIDKIFLSNSAGSVNPEYPPGEFLVITDHLLLSPLMLDEDYLFPPASAIWDPKPAARLCSQAKANGINAHTGTYAWTTGPSYETPAEVRYLQNLGADAVGMSTIPEAISAKQLDIQVLGISCLTNYATGPARGSLTHQEVRRMAQRMETALSNLLFMAIKLFSNG